MKRNVLYKMMMVSPLVLAGTGIASAQSNTSGVLDRDDGIYLRCALCGTVESITQNVGSPGSGSNTAATITGSVVGGLIGSRLGGGRGRSAATAAGVVAGGAAGSAAGNSSQPTTWTVRVRLGPSNFMNVTVNDASDLRVGDTVEVGSNGYVTRLR